MLEMPYCNSTSFQIFLDEFSRQKQEEYKIIILDNGAFHKAKTLQVPENIAFIFLPPYSPELNPAENMWAKLKRTFTNRPFKTLDEPSDFICTVTKTINRENVKKTCASSYIFEGQLWTKL